MRSVTVTRAIRPLTWVVASGSWGSLSSQQATRAATCTPATWSASRRSSSPYVGRKIIVWPNDTDGDLQSVPALDAPKGPSLSDSDRAILRTAWDLMSEIFASALPPGLGPPPYAVAIEVLKYPDSQAT